MPFKAMGLHHTLLQAIKEMRYVEPTPVQAEAIPAILAGGDLIATAQTGTGKTAAFLLPILHQLMGLPHGMTRALVISPTRELAQQIDDVCLGLAYHTTLRTGLIVGGSAMGPQEKALRAGVEIIVATPGRLLDHMRMNQTRFDKLHTLVLDEADRMLDMGFLPDLKRIIARLPNREQTLLFSATMPPVIARLAGEILHNPKTIQCGRQGTPAIGITQAAYPVPEHLKTNLLRYLLRHIEMPSVLVFTRTKQGARRLAKQIAGDGFKVSELHSNLTQPQRVRAMEGFRRGDFQVLVATNIAARGLDVTHITHVISFDVPHVPEDYVHRIGRTARHEGEGDAFVLVAPAEEKSLARIERQIGLRLPRVELPDFDYTQMATERTGRSGPRGQDGRCHDGRGERRHGGSSQASRGTGHGGGSSQAPRDTGHGGGGSQPSHGTGQGGGDSVYQGGSRRRRRR